MAALPSKPVPKKDADQGAFGEVRQSQDYLDYANAEGEPDQAPLVEKAPFRQTR